MTTINPDRRTSGTPLIGQLAERDAGIPQCEYCGTDEFLIYEDFIPARIPEAGGKPIAGNVSYSCSVCGRFNGHQVPASWSPPHWFWYN